MDIKPILLSLIVCLLSNCAAPVDPSRSSGGPTSLSTDFSKPKPTPRSNVVTIEDGMAPLPPSSLAQTEANFRVALLVPQSGKNQAMGQSLAESAALSLSRLPNAPKIHVDIVDSTPLNASTVQAMKNRFLNDKIDFIIGPVFAEQAQLLHTALASSSPTPPPLITFSNTRKIAKTGLYVAGFDPFSEVLSATKALTEAGSCYFLIMPANEAGYALDEALKTTLQTAQAKTLGTFYYQQSTLKDLETTLAQANQAATACPPRPSGNTFSTLVALSGSQLKTVMAILQAQKTDIIAPSSAGSSINPVFYADVDRITLANVESYYQGVLGRSPSRLDLIAYDMISLAGYLEQSGGTSNFKNPSGFQGIVGLFRFQDQGTIERAFAIYKNHQGMIEQITPAPQRFTP